MSVRNENQDADHLVGRLLGERYRLVTLLGSGASAHVYLADDLAIGRPVAVKQYRRITGGDELRHRFHAAVDGADSLSHPNLLAVYDWGDDTGGPYLVTELLLGGSLRDITQRGISLSPSQGLLVALQAAYGLDHAHELGWVHGAITPAKLLFGPEGRLRLAGLVSPSEVPIGDGTSRGHAMPEATRYAAPERVGGAAIDGAADLYSLVLAIAEAVTGHVPLLADGAASTRALRQHYDVGPLEALGPLGAALEPAGRADTSERPTASELVDALTDAARTLPRPDRLPLVHQDLDPSAQRYLDGDGPTLDLREGPARITAHEHDRAEDASRVDEPAPARRSSDQLAYDPIPRPPANGAGVGSEPLLRRPGPTDGRNETLRPDEITVIHRPPARLRPTQPPIVDAAEEHSPGHLVAETDRGGETNAVAGTDLGSDTDARSEIDLARKVELAHAADVAAEIDSGPQGRSAGSQRTGSRPGTSWLDQAKLDPPARSVEPTDGAATIDRSEPRRPPLVELSAPLSLSRVVEQAPLEVPALGEPPLDRWEVADLDELDPDDDYEHDDYQADFEADDEAEYEAGYEADDDGAGFGEHDFAEADLDLREFDDSDLDGPAEELELDLRYVDQSTVRAGDSSAADLGPAPAAPAPPTGPPAHASYASRRSVLAATDLGDDDVFTSAERLARPPEPGRLQLPPPIHRPATNSSPLASWLVSTFQKLGSPGPPAWWATGMVVGVLVVLLIAVLGLRVTNGTQTDASAGTLGAASRDVAGGDATPVGSYVGSEIDAAQADAAANGWELNTIRVWREGTTPGEIVEQAPLPGTPLARGGRLDVVVTQGPELVPIPPVLGHTADEAVAMLTDSGLVLGTMTEVESDAAPGSVIATAVDGPEPAATMVEPGAAIDLILSAQGTAVPMPSFVGLSVERAIAQANELGVELLHGEVASTHWAEGLVADTTPPTDTPIRPGDQVTIYISTGPPGT